MFEVMIWTWVCCLVFILKEIEIVKIKDNKNPLFRTHNKLATNGFLPVRFLGFKYHSLTLNPGV